MFINIFWISHLLIGLLVFFLGLAVLNKNFRSLIGGTFFLLTTSISIWSLAYSIWLLSGDREAALFWSRVLNVGSYFIPVFYLHWVLVLINKHQTHRSLLIICYVLTVTISFFGFSDFMVKDVHQVLQFSYYPQAGWLYTIWLVLIWSITIVYSQALLIREYRRAVGVYRQQILYVFIGSAIGFIGGSTNHLLMFGFELIPPIGSPLVGLFPLVLGYSIIEHRLMDIKFVMRKYSVSVISFIIILLPILAIKYYVDRQLLILAGAVDVILLLLALWAFPLLKHSAAKLANKYFFSSLYDSKKVIAEVSEKLRSTLNITQVYDYIYSSIEQAMHVRSFGVLRYDERRKYYSTQFNINFNIGRRVNFEQDDFLLNYFAEKHKYLIVSENIRGDNVDQSQDILRLLFEMRIELILPLNIKGKLVGLIVMGGKESGDLFNEEDLQVLSIVASQSAMAIENAMLYEETKNFSLRMAEEVAKATMDLRAANERLTRLDEVKSEFISIASHQLRTPLTVIKGYISMMLEGSFGKVPAYFRDPMDKVYQSNERLIVLVENLLNVSRIESGHLKFNLERVSLSKMVSDIIEELDSKARVRGLEFEFKLPKKELPGIVLDTEKIRHVIMNLLDNSIKYANQGKIKVSLKQRGKYLLFCVSDKGMGIDVNEIPGLFKKFARGTAAILQHTEGTGLGLYVAKEMIDAHHGRIWAESPGEGKGAKFCFEIPIDNV
jgi:signal transduction histidine kinase